MHEQLVIDASEMASDLVVLRRALHQDPEVGYDLPRTQRAILQALEGLPLEISTGTSLGSVTAVLRGAHDGPVVLLRGDMDALPVVEETGLPFASKNGAMHACGHDLHATGLVGAAKLLSARRESLAGTVVFMFQPGEEAGAGAPKMIVEGVLDAAGAAVNVAYGVHVLPGERGVFQTKPGSIMAGASVFEVTVHGKGGHGSRPHEAVDPVPVLAEIVLALQTYATRRLAPFDPAIISVTQLSGSSAVNIIPDSASLGATVRTLSREVLAQLQSDLPRLAERIAEAHGCTADTKFTVTYPVTVNDADTTEQSIETLREVFGDARVERLDAPIMASEDFAFVLDAVPGTFFFVGATVPGTDPADVEMNHSPRVVFDDAVLADQAAALAALALSHLQAE